MDSDDRTAFREARRILSDAERERLAVWSNVQEQVFAAMLEQKTEFTLTLPVMEWLSWIDEVQDRPARNMSRLIRDDLIEQLGLATERLHEELNYIVAFGQAPTVAERYVQTRGWPKRKIPISNELRESIAKMKPPEDGQS